jgi:hypothetical protein
VYDVELSEAEVLDLYENGVPPALSVAPQAKLAVVWAALK